LIFSFFIKSVYDVTRKETFDSLSMWLQEVEQFSMGGGKEVVKLLVGNKIDQQRVVQREVADEWARSRGMLFMEASAKTKEGIAQVFNEVVTKVSSFFLFVNLVFSLSFSQLFLFIE
jgi:Ras-related protein Rab-18